MKFKIALRTMDTGEVMISTITLMGEKVYELDKNLGGLQSRFEKEYHSDFSFLMTSLALGMRKAVLVKFAVIKEIVQKGTDTRLQEALAKVSPDVLRFG